MGTEVPKKEKKGRRNKKKDEYIPRAPKPAPGQKVAIEEPEPEPEPEPEAEPERPWEELEGDDAYPFISVGLIGESSRLGFASSLGADSFLLLAGQPNVGKSSLLNALLGRKVVRASRTPGKTKTLQVSYDPSCLLLSALTPSSRCRPSSGTARSVSSTAPVSSALPSPAWSVKSSPVSSPSKT